MNCLPEAFVLLAYLYKLVSLQTVSEVTPVFVLASPLHVCAPLHITAAPVTRLLLCAFSFLCAV